MTNAGFQKLVSVRGAEQHVLAGNRMGRGLASVP